MVFYWPIRPSNPFARKMIEKLWTDNPRFVTVKENHILFFILNLLIKKLVNTCEEGKVLAEKVRKRAISTEVLKINTEVVP